MSPGEEDRQPPDPWMSWRTRLVGWLFKNKTRSLKAGVNPITHKIIAAYLTGDQELIFLITMSEAEARAWIREIQAALKVREMM